MFSLFVWGGGHGDVGENGCGRGVVGDREIERCIHKRSQRTADAPEAGVRGRGLDRPAPPVVVLARHRRGHVGAHAHALVRLEALAREEPADGGDRVLSG